MGNALCNFADSKSYIGEIFSGNTDDKALVLATSRFALELYKEQVKRCEGNLFISPIIISAVLSMAYLGARGETLEEMRKTLCFDAIEDANVHKAFGNLVNHLKKSRKELHMANRLYGEESYKILKEFQSACRNHYDAELVPVSFLRNDTDKAIKTINNWVETNTNQKIKDILSPGSVGATTVLVLVNAIYFKSAWLHEFWKFRTHEANFHVSKYRKIKVQMMSRMVKKANYFYSIDLLCQVLKLPYKSGALSMFILLPDSNGKSYSLEDLEKKLTGDQLVNIESGFKEHPDVNLWLPKFKMEETLELMEVLGDMGMKSIFQEGSADLSGMDGTKELYVSKVLHKAFVDVNEEGTEAAAATAVANNSRRVGAKEREKPVEFRADHPFMFFIRTPTLADIECAGLACRKLLHVCFCRI